MLYLVTIGKSEVKDMTECRWNNTAPSFTTFLTFSWRWMSGSTPQHDVITFMFSTSLKTSHPQSARDISPLCLPTQPNKYLHTSPKRTAYPNSIAFHPFSCELSLTADTVKWTEKSGWKGDRGRIGWVGGGGGWQKIDVSVDFAGENKGVQDSEA